MAMFKSTGRSNVSVDLTTASKISKSGESNNKIDHVLVQSLLTTEAQKRSNLVSQSFFSKLRRQISGRLFRKDLQKNRLDFEATPACSSEPTSSSRSNSEDALLEEIDDFINSNGKKKLTPAQLASIVPKISRILQAPAVYEDPYCSVAVDGAIYVSEYYLTSSPNAERRFGNRETKSSKRTFLQDIATIFHCAVAEAPENLYKEWGLSRNSVWWANDNLRRLHNNPDTELVTLRVKSTFPIQVGLTVVNFRAFKSAMHLCGLSEQCYFVSNLPAVNCDVIRYIDDTDEVSVDEYVS